MWERMKKLLNVTKPQSQIDNAGNKPAPATTDPGTARGRVNDPLAVGIEESRWSFRFALSRLPLSRKAQPQTKMQMKMKTLAGLWIDHREAVVVLVSEKGQETRRIKSHVEKQLRRSGRSPSKAPFEPQIVPADDSRERGYKGHLANFYDEVISFLRPAKTILLFGPGEAKSELRKRIERDKLDLRITRFETSDKMTEGEISQKVRRHYFPSDATPPASRRSKR